MLPQRASIDRWLAFRRSVLVLMCLSFLTAACHSPIQEQATLVARHWAMTIRAGQVIPVYPLTEDLRPGDVFLVTQPAEEQARRYDERGYLPLDQHLVRLHDLPYGGFYADGYWQSGFGTVPHPRLQRSADDEAAEPLIVAAIERAPLVFFPSYEFTVDRSAGFQAALPIKGVPLGLELMGTDNARVSVTVEDAFSYGLDIAALVERLEGWAQQPDVRAMLARIHDQDGRSEAVYLRVVNRVYLTGGVAIAIHRTGGRERGFSAGAAPQPGKADAADLKALSETFSRTLPEGRVDFAYASDSTVMLSERFPRPLAIGYIGIDVPVHRGGELGPPVTTRAILSRETRPPVPVAKLSEDQQQLYYRQLYLLELARSRDASERRTAARAVQLAAGHLPGEAFEDFGAWLETSEAAESTEGVVHRFFDAVDRYVAADGDRGMRYRRILTKLDAVRQPAASHTRNVRDE